MDSFSYQDYILPYSTLKTSSQPFGHGIPEFSLTNKLLVKEKTANKHGLCMSAIS